MRKKGQKECNFVAFKRIVKDTSIISKHKNGSSLVIQSHVAEKKVGIKKCMLILGLFCSLLGKHSSISSCIIRNPTNNYK